MFIEKLNDLGGKTADLIARWGGSWSFIFAGACFIAVWMLVNKGTGAFDPYPYILLNLVFSGTAFFQAPIIMMSQNRAAELERQKEFARQKKEDEMTIKQFHLSKAILTILEEFKSILSQHKDIYSRLDRIEKKVDLLLKNRLDPK